MNLCNTNNINNKNLCNTKNNHRGKDDNSNGSS